MTDSNAAKLMPSPNEIERCEVKMEQAHDAINVCKALLIKHNWNYVTQTREVKPSAMFGQAGAFVWPSDLARIQVPLILLPIRALDATRTTPVTLLHMLPSPQQPELCTLPEME